MMIIKILLLVLCFSAILFYICGIYAALAFSVTSTNSCSSEYHPPVTILKPLSGVETDTYANLASFCQQHYPKYQIIFSVRDRQDPVIAVVEKLKQQFPAVDMELVVSDRLIGANLKVSNLANGLGAAKYDILIIADSDISVGEDYLQHVVQPLQDQKVGVVTCLYRSTAKGLAATFEALGTASDFHAGVLVSRLLEGVKFAFGSTIAIRRQVLEQIGGFAAIANYLADDYQLGYLPSQAGYKVILSDYIVNHHLAKTSLADCGDRQIRWARCIRVSRPGGYWGLLFTFGTVYSLLLVIFTGGAWFAWLVLAVTWGMRLLMGWIVGVKILADPVVRKFFWLIPLRDIIYFLIWCCGFVGNKIQWRGQQLKLVKGGKLEMI
ncbi:MAG TPA: bacteriohopanetetrol glucosamine biosynthesis glycosyltransferase HpnI [Nostocaceae cyanobacterium]|nr:bacteriohopanetetrol glucosamine biosynthesis glycosyltransferase HpnI [Nostocaceae cyanobacterium]